MKNSLLLPLAAALCLSACAVSPNSAEWVQPVHNQNAIFLWKHSGGSLSGKVVITYDISGNVMIRILKDLPKPLLEITSTRDGKFFATGPLSGGGWSGTGDRVPVRFSLWKAVAEAWRGAIPARDGAQEVHTQTYRAAISKVAGRVRELSVSSSDNGEVIRLVMAGTYPKGALATPQ
jgi:opacity protein-like surface antigen